MNDDFSSKALCAIAIIAIIQIPEYYMQIDVMCFRDDKSVSLS